MNFLTDVLHPRKWHLYSLPALPEGLLNPYRFSADAHACVVLPVFAAEVSDDWEIKRSCAVEDYVAKAAAWATWTWVSNSDARHYGIPIYIYVDTSIADLAVPILQENHVPETFIRVADYEGPEYAKSLSPWFDASLSTHKWILSADVDLFVMSGRGRAPGSRSLDIFNRLASAALEGIGVAECWQRQGPILKSDVLYWIDRLFYLLPAEEIQGKDTTDLYAVWQKRVEALIGEHRGAVFKKKLTPFAYPFASVWALPTSFQDKDWFREACALLGDDEAILSVWHAKGGLLWEFCDIGVPHFYDYSSLNQPDPHLLHFGDSYDHKFMQRIGACERDFFNR